VERKEIVETGGYIYDVWIYDRNNGMNINILPAIGGCIGLAGFLAAMAYVGYLAWFHPARFREQEVKRVKDWWPFANYFRRYHSSNEYLWTARIGSTIFLLIFLIMGVLAFLGYLGFIP
jgi:hypothetical protein